MCDSRSQDPLDDEALETALAEAARLAQENPLPEDNAARFYGRILDHIYAQETQDMRAQVLAGIMALRRARLARGHGSD